ncbi:hypothetical protein DL93DRAFT_1840593 [Clavulina sp. PMI_390]|nr:hypothetical protein DL93DRAFT_1840593 [Clavulina sp. PMI_390]
MKSESALALDLAAALLQNALPDAIGPAFRTDLSQHLLRTPPAERPARKRDLQAAIADVDETINSVRAIHDVVTLMLNTLLRKRTALHHALQSPVHALPTEILQRIFSMLVYEARETDIAIALTHVCSSWRFVALGSGRLWEHVRARTTSSLSELVGRSAPHQFSLELQLSFILGLPEAPSGLPKIQLHPENARRLNLLCLSDPSVLRHLDFPDAAALPNLGGLQLEAGLSLDMTHFPSLPSGLTSVLNILIQNWDRPRCFMNNGSWPRLMSICFQSSSVTSVSRVLDEMIAPCLTTLFFVTMMDDYWTGSLDIMTQGPHSVNSVIIVDSSRFVYSFGRNFHLFPNLTSFTVVRLDEESRYSWVTLVSTYCAAFLSACVVDGHTYEFSAAMVAPCYKVNCGPGS